jgi:hypothetical protein
LILTRCSSTNSSTIPVKILAFAVVIGRGMAFPAMRDWEAYGKQGGGNATRSMVGRPDVNRLARHVRIAPKRLPESQTLIYFVIVHGERPMRPFLWICLAVFATVMEGIGWGLHKAIAAYGPLIVIPVLGVAFIYAFVIDRREGRY